MQNTLKLYSLDFSDSKAYMYALLFALGNIVLPQLVHMVPNGGLIWLPIYFFTLVGSFKYGTKVGLMTALASPLVNSMLFGMPCAAMLPVIVTKSVLLALIAGTVASKAKSASLLMFLVVVFGYQFLGGMFEMLYVGSVEAAVQDVKIGFPGLLVQIFGGYIFVNNIIRN